MYKNRQPVIMLFVEQDTYRLPYPILYIENQTTTPHLISIWHYDFHCVYGLGDGWFLCEGSI